MAMPLLLLLTILQLLPAFLCWKAKRVNFLALVGISHFIGYSLVPWYLLAFEHKPITTPPLAGILLVVGTIFLGMGYYLGKRILPSYRKIQLEENLPSQISTNFYLIGIFISFALMKFLPPEFLLLLKSFQFFFLVLIVKQFVKEGIAESFVHLMTLLFFSLYSYLEYKNVEFAIFLVILLLALAVFHKSHRPIAYGAVCLLWLVFLQMQKGEYRTNIGNEKVALTKKMQVLYSLIHFKYFGGPTPERLPSSLVTEAIERSASRLYDDSLERVLKLTPDTVPYWKGKSYWVLPHLLFLPLTHSQWNLWNLFGQTYGYLAPNDKITEVVFSYFAEGYINFGITGLLVEAFLVGILFFLLEWIAFHYYQQFHFEALLCLLVPLLSYQTDLGAGLARVVLSLCVLTLFRSLSIAYRPQS